VLEEVRYVSANDGKASPQKEGAVFSLRGEEKGPAVQRSQREKVSEGQMESIGKP